MPGICDPMQLGLRESLVQLPSCDGWTDGVVTTLHDSSCAIVSDSLPENELVLTWDVTDLVDVRLLQQLSVF